jgi:hypothetical protein
MVRLGISLAAAAHAERVRLGALGWAGETAAFLNILQPTQCAGFILLTARS